MTVTVAVAVAGEGEEEGAASWPPFIAALQTPATPIEALQFTTSCPASHVEPAICTAFWYWIWIWIWAWVWVRAWLSVGV